MPSSYSARLRLELQADGENSGTWGQRLNTVIQLIEEATDGYLAKAVTDGADTVLTAVNGAADESRQRVLKLTGALTAQRNVVVPTVEKFYLIWNATTGGFGVQVKTAAGTGIVVPMNGKAVLFCDGVNIEQIMLLSSFGQTLIDDADAAAARTTLGLDLPLAIGSGGTGQTTAAAAFGALKQNATEAATGVLEIATQAEIETGTDVVRAVTPGRLVPSAMAWTGAHAFSSAGLTERIVVKSTEPGAAVAEGATLFRDSASPAAADLGVSISWDFRDSLAAVFQGAEIVAEIVDPTTATQDARIDFYTMIAGAKALRGYWGDGLVLGAPTGGDAGLGFLNALGLRINNVDVVGDIDLLTLANDPASSAFVAGSTAAATNRKFRVGEVGGWVPLAEQTASASANLNFVLTSYLTDFEDFEFIIDHIAPATDLVDFMMRLSTDGGVTYDAGAGAYEYSGVGETSALVSAVSTGDTRIILHDTTSTMGNVAGEFISGKVVLLNAAVTTKRPTVMIDTVYINSTPHPGSIKIGAFRLANQDTDAVRFLMSSGNIASGKITLMGRRKVL